MIAVYYSLREPDPLHRAPRLVRLAREQRPIARRPVQHLGVPRIPAGERLPGFFVEVDQAGDGRVGGGGEEVEEVADGDEGEGEVGGSLWGV